MEQNHQQPYPKPNNLLALSILIAAVLVSGAIVFASTRNGGETVANAPDAQANTPAASEEQTVGEVKPVTAADHIRGGIDAPVKIVEFSDTECPFCKSFHPTMQQAVKDYDGQVAWIYRHFPLDAIHSKARKEAEATECAGELGGNDKFWAYLDRLFQVTPSNDRLDLAQLPEIAAYVGLDKAKFNECLNSGKYADHIAADLEDAQKSGGQGTPWSVVIAPNGKKFPLSGAQPYESVKQLIEIALQEK